MSIEPAKDDDIAVKDQLPEGCPVGDPECLGRADQCHDACESPEGQF
jgi:hypothetical protein